jgi:hypothetical protein
MLNLQTPESILAALRLVRRGRLYSLAVPLEKDGPQFVSFHKTWCVTHFTRDPTPGAFNVADDVVTMESHSGTHVDALPSPGPPSPAPAGGRPVCGDGRAAGGPGGTGVETARQALGFMADGTAGVRRRSPRRTPKGRRPWRRALWILGAMTLGAGLLLAINLLVIPLGLTPRWAASLRGQVVDAATGAPGRRWGDGIPRHDLCPGSTGMGQERLRDITLRVMIGTRYDRG